MDSNDFRGGPGAPIGVPAALSKGWIDFLKLCPKSLFQIVDSSIISSFSSFRSFQLGYKTSVFFSEKFEFYDLSMLKLLCPEGYAVCFIHSESVDPDKLRSFGLKHIFVCYLGASEEYMNKCIDEFGSNVFSTPSGLISLLINFLKESSLLAEDLKDTVIPAVANWEVDETYVLSNFNPSLVNRLFSLNFNRKNWLASVSPEALEVSDRNEELYSSLVDLDSLHISLRDESKGTGVSVASNMPSLFIVQPYINANLFNLGRVLNGRFAPISNAYINSFRRGLNTEQSYVDYTFPVQVLDGNAEDSMKGFAFGGGIHAERISALDNIVFLHASFHSNPVLRLPLGGKKFDQFLKYFSPEDYKKTNDFKKLKKHLTRVGRTFHESLNEKIKQYIASRGGQIVAVSDLPIEWMNINDVPLFMYSDVCRLLETSHGSLMSQYVKSVAWTFSIKEDVLSRTLVVCLSPDDVNIYSSFSAVKKLAGEKDEMAGIVFEEARSKEELSQLVKRHKPDILILDTHGVNNPEKLESVLSIGKETLTGEDVVNYGISAPVVILSCCFSAPTYGYINPIAHAFFEGGALTVLSTLLPIDIRKGTSLYFRILRNLSTCSKTRIHPNLLNFFSHVIRTSVFEDYTMPLLDEFDLSEQEIEVYLKVKLKWYLQMSNVFTRKDAFKNIGSYIVDSFPKRYKRRVSNYLRSSPVIFDSYYYTILGRADLVPFEVFDYTPGE
ncbi:hypothetical protein BALOs_2216 [Halobacteriovorax sp. BALOs_7]|uniref:CHAT domain-containing protein n=1 Tax=Halobacteriovorax sp. BALOs_7 TaxID=2109558 RepID=UPI000EA32B06|nr:CHAT domain-containing protein [Halobacteriovorax sp. BALOs_7]AYF45214.1 hypothetical protein BALOs_2216 [Halobacteriovorax sp. BALOs_7]